MQIETSAIFWQKRYNHLNININNIPYNPLKQFLPVDNGDNVDNFSMNYPYFHRIPVSYKWLIDKFMGYLSLKYYYFYTVVEV